MRRLLILALLMTPASAAADPELQQTDLFEAGKGGYALYRIPGIVVTTKGTMLAYCEARKSDRGDWGPIDILLRRSTDGGKTFDAPRKLVTIEGKVPKNPVALKQKLAQDGGDPTINNPVAIVDRQPGVVHFLYCVEYARCYYMRSDDDGLTFTKAVDITPTFEQFRKDYDYSVLATGPGHGIQLKNGRLLVPVWLSTGTGGHAHRPSCLSVIYSDDHGKTWQRGDVVAVDPKPKNPNETIAIQLHDNRVLLNIRHEMKPTFRGISISDDGATKWSPLRFDAQLPDAICMASIIRLTEQPMFAKNRIVFANPNSQKLTPNGGWAGKAERKNLTLRLSYDETKTWPVSKVLAPGIAGYSDLAVGPDATIYCLYERGGLEGSPFKTGALTLAQFNLEWLTDGKDRLDPVKK